jgi:NADH dehydrogenase/NADH:ubiquinone oxidoreductase subunit G
VAQIVLPVAVHAETAGTFVNAKGMAQQFKRAVFPPPGVKPAWQLVAELAQAMGKDLRLGSLSDVRAALPAPVARTQEAQV